MPGAYIQRRGHNAIGESWRKAVETFIKNFIREGEGAWRCISPAELQVDVGRIQVAPGTMFTLGTRFMGVDLASLLEEHHRRYGSRTS